MSLISFSEFQKPYTPEPIKPQSFFSMLEFDRTKKPAPKAKIVNPIPPPKVGQARQIIVAEWLNKQTKPFSMVQADEALGFMSDAAIREFRKAGFVGLSPDADKERIAQKNPSLWFAVLKPIPAGYLLPGTRK